MLHFTKGTDTDIICTLTEKIIFGYPYLLLRFTHIVSRSVIEMVIPYADDLSQYQERYNQFKITADKIENANDGMYTYSVYEIPNETDQPSAAAIETGRAYIHDANPNNYTEYRPQTTQVFKIYDGQ